MSRAFLELNRSVSHWFARHWPYRREGVGTRYVERVMELANPGELITDVGAGRATPFASLRERGCRILGVDVLSADLQANRGLTERVTRDIVTEGLPDEARGSQMVCSRFVLEHMPDLDAFTHDAFAVTSPGGYTAHLFAGRWSAFAIVNRFVPDAVSRRCLFALRPESREVGGFPTYYDRTDPPSARERFRAAGFTEVQTELSWEVSHYFAWCFPLYVLARAWESLARRLGIQAMASYVVLTARRPEEIEALQLAAVSR